MHPENARNPYPQQYPSQEPPKPAAQVHTIIANIQANNNILMRNCQRVEDALMRLGHSFPPQENVKSAAIAPVPNGHFGMIAEETIHYANLNDRLAHLLEILESLI